jgi:hypothetical protein
MRPPNALSAQLGKIAAPHPTCDARSCNALATGQMVVLLAPSRTEPHIRNHLNFYLCDTHREDIPNAEALWERVPGLWDHIVELLTPSGRIPVKALTRLEYEECPPPPPHRVH